MLEFFLYYSEKVATSIVTLYSVNFYFSNSASYEEGGG